LKCKAVSSFFLSENIIDDKELWTELIKSSTTPSITVFFTTNGSIPTSTHGFDGYLISLFCKGKIMLRSLLRMHRRHMPFFLGGGVISIFVPWKHHSGFDKR
jgi:hypothetical protein